MFDWDLKKRVVCASVSVLIIAVAILGCKFYQSPTKTEQIYSAALKDIEKGDYQNAYYLFSKINIFSNLKPVSIYHRAECAKMIGDSKSEIKQYQLLFNNYPEHKLSVRAKYLVAQKLVKDNPNLAKKYFESIIKKAPNTDYAVAAEYYLGVILINKYENSKIFPNSAKEDIQNYFRHYLKHAPSGKHAYSVVIKWLEAIDEEDIVSDDYLLMANTTFLFGEYEKTAELLKQTGINENWVLAVKNAFAKKDFSNAKKLAETGIEKYTDYVSEEDVIETIDIYLKLAANKPYSVNYLSSLSPLKAQDYLLNLKCQNVAQSEKISCFSDLYLKYPNGRFSADALSNLFFEKIKNRDYIAASKIGKDHLQKFPDSNSAPMVMFWLGKIAEKTNNYEEYTKYYENVIKNYPDSYYAYRAYLRLKRYQGSLITSFIEPKPVMFPYKYPKNNIIVKLVKLKDYEIIKELIGDDDFVKSWVLYKEGDFSNSMLVARDAMEKIKNKPDKYDFRWRLVYPVIYYDEIRKYAGETGNNAPLLLALTREESYFDPLAQSIVGASGLMQIMPTTASEINSRFGLGMNISEDLFNPYSNLKLGNYYYEFLRTNLEGYDVSSVAAYNGGIGSIQRWKTSLNYSDTDEFVEQIPYPETKNYVKKVFRSYWNYIRIYNGKE